MKKPWCIGPPGSLLANTQIYCTSYFRARHRDGWKRRCVDLGVLLVIGFWGVESELHTSTLELTRWDRSFQSRSHQ
jgi:hypothetical protein